MLESRCVDLGLSNRVRFTGHLTRAQLLTSYSNSDIDVFVLASYIEGIPVSAMEASAWGIPCVVTDVGGVKELLGNGAGILVLPGDAAALAGALDTLLTNPDLRHRLGVAARNRVEQSFDARRTASEFLRLVQIHSGLMRDQAPSSLSAFSRQSDSD
jgi:glycosyltransferase involved in cell wall biosynthesis